VFDDMVAGLQIFNDYNTIQIDSSFSNFFLKEKRFVSLISTHPGFRGAYETYTAEVTFNGIKNPLLFIGESSAGVSVIGSVQTGSSITYTLNCAVSLSFYVFLYDQTPPVNTGFGLQIFDEKGGLMFDAGGRLLNILGSVPLQSFGVSSVLNQSTAGRTLAVKLNTTATHRRITGGQGSALLSVINSIRLFSGYSVQYGTTNWYIASLGGDTAPQDPDYTTFLGGRVRVLVADVTGL